MALLEILIAIVIMTIALLGLAGLQARMLNAEFESYQRSQAIMLLQDMAARINANRKNAANYVTAGPLGVGSTIDCTAVGTDLVLRDKCEWNDALAGASETTGGGANKLGAMSGARGCISNPVATMPREVVVAIAWQGTVPTIAPGATTCGQGSYGGDDRFRRAMIARVKIGCLQNDPDTGNCVTP